MILQAGSDLRELHGKAQHFAIVRSFVRQGEGLERVSLIWIACPSTRQFHLCSTYQHGKYSAGVHALELPRVARDSTQYGMGRQGEYPEAERPERNDLDAPCADKIGQAVPRDG
jgi:hypothetical protein